jgi:hypothetical protein
MGWDGVLRVEHGDVGEPMGLEATGRLDPVLVLNVVPGVAQCLAQFVHHA